MRREMRVVLAQPPVPDKGNEITVEAVLLTPTQVAGRIVTADAMHTQRTCCADIHRFGGYYVLFAKANQPTDGGRICGSSSASHPLIAGTGGKRIPGAKDMGGWRCANWLPAPNSHEWRASTWPGVEQVFWLQRTISRQGQQPIQTIYGITNLSPTHASAAQLLEVVRRHWTIENRLHWRGDVTLGEDHCQVRKGAAPLVLAALNSLVLAVFDLSSGGQCPAADASLGCPPSAGGPACPGFLADYYIALLARLVVAPSLTIMYDNLTNCSAKKSMYYCLALPEERRNIAECLSMLTNYARLSRW